MISGFGLAHKLPAKMPMRDKLIDVSRAYNAYARAWRASLAALFASFSYTWLRSRFSYARPRH